MLIKKSENTGYSSLKKIIALLLALILLIIAVMFMPEAKAYAEESGSSTLSDLLSDVPSSKT